MWRPSRHRLLRAAHDVGFRAFDTAPLYGNGLAELEIGDALKDRRNDVALTTKFGIPVKLYGARHPRLFTAHRLAAMALDREYRKSFDLRDWRPETLRDQVEASLRRLGTDRIDRLCCHEPLTAIPRAQWDGLIEQSQRLKAEGKILKFGLSGSQECMSEMALRPGLDFVQTHIAAAAEFAAWSRLPATAFGIYAGYAASRDQGSFAQYLQKSAAQPGLEQIILTSRRLDRVMAMKSFF